MIFDTFIQKNKITQSSITQFIENQQIKWSSHCVQAENAKHIKELFFKCKKGEKKEEKSNLQKKKSKNNWS